MVQLSAGWRLAGTVELHQRGVGPVSLRYQIECDDHWRTRDALIEASVHVPVTFELMSDGVGHWKCNGAIASQITGAVDIDLGFTPMTNTLPIRRLALEVGGYANVRSAWLRFPELRLESLDQTYSRVADRRFRYEAIVDGEPFTAILDTDTFGRVLRYEGLWEAESSEPPIR